MKNKFLIICAVVLFSGVILCGVGFACGARFYGLSLNADGLQINSNKGGNGESAKFVEESKDLEEFKNLKLNVDFADVRIVESDHYGIDYGMYENQKLIIEKQGDTMVITQKNLKGNFTFFSFGASITGITDREQYATLYVKKGQEFGTVEVNNESGIIDIDSLTADSISIDDSFGDIRSESMKADDIVIRSESGKISADDIQADTLEINNTFGKVNVKKLQAKTGTFDMESCSFKVDTMNVNDMKLKDSFGDMLIGTAVAKKVSIDIESGACSIEDLSAEDVKTNVTFGATTLGLHEGVDNYTTNATVEFGKVIINGDEQGEECHMTAANSNRTLTLESESGDITLEDAR